MCGLIALVNNNLTKIAMNDFMKQGLMVNSLRGMDSTGIFAIDEKGQYMMDKKVMCGFDFVEMPGFDKVMGILQPRFIVGHNRFGTRGVNSLKNAHPIMHNDILLVHNGTLSSLIQLNLDLKIEDCSVHDSTAIAMSLDRRGAEATLPLLEGSYALIWYDDRDKTLNFARNKDRTLFVAYEKDGQGVFAASEPKMLAWMTERNRIAIRGIAELKEGVLLTIPLDKKGKETKTKFNIYKAPVWNNGTRNPTYTTPYYASAKVGDTFEASFCGEFTDVGKNRLYWRFKRVYDTAWAWEVDVEESVFGKKNEKPRMHYAYMLKALEERFSTSDHMDKKAEIVSQVMSNVLSLPNPNSNDYSKNSHYSDKLSYYKVGDHVRFMITDVTSFRGRAAEGITADSNSVAVRCVGGAHLKQGEGYQGKIKTHAMLGNGKKAPEPCLIIDKDHITGINLGTERCCYCEVLLTVEEELSNQGIPKDQRACLDCTPEPLITTLNEDFGMGNLN